MPRTLQDILDEAQTLPPHERLPFIRQACASDEALYERARGELESRVRWIEDGSAPAEPRTEEALPDPAGERIGPYRIVRSLGSGGMGEVFLAERADDLFRHRVAIKLVRRGLLSRQVQGRLKLERQILATLDHPNIARLFDGGTTEDGTPYIVMEYVEGEPIDIYCDARGLPVAERLRLFRIVCSAVHRAHQNLIVHRDLKPSNILVTREGTPKLLDFGIAKLLDERQQMMHTMAVTQADYRVLTPDHASPEQLRGELITTSSDIYVLGVLLYELLCGARPFPLQSGRLAELERAICEDPPAPPSAALTQAGTQIAACRSSTPARLRRELAGDLDNIVLMAMRKEPERRYSSVEQLSSDVGRYLEGMPVLARADAWRYRAGKFIARHRLVASLLAAFVALLIGFSATTYVQARRIERERDLAELERERAQAEQQRAEAVSEFLIDSFRHADPSLARGKDVTAREILDRGAARVANELGAQPALQATLLDTIGSVYLSLDLPLEAQPLIEQGLEVRRELFGEAHPEVARSLYSLNRVYEKRGDLETAERLAVQSLEIHRRETGAESLESAGSLCRLGVIQHARGELSRAQEQLEACLRIRIAQLGREHASITVPLDNLARLAQQQRDFATAERLYREALDIDEQTRGRDHPQFARHLHNLATALHEKGDLDAAEAMYRQALELYRQILGTEHTETVVALGNLGRLLMSRERFAEAEQAYQAALAANRRLYGPRHSAVAYNIESLGRLAFERGRLGEAERHYREALEIYRETLPPGHGYTAAASTWLGRTLLERGLPAQAEAELTRAVAEWAREYGTQSPWHAQARAALGRAETLQGKLDAAERDLLQSYPVLAEHLRDHEMTTRVRGWIEDLYRARGEPAAARDYFARIETKSGTQAAR